MPAATAYLRPRTIDGALRAIADGHTVLAGGTDVYPALVGRPAPAGVVDITAIDELRGIDQIRAADSSRWLRIGAATTWTALTTITTVDPGCRALAEAAVEVGAIQIQNAGTIAGNLCTASPAGDGIPVLLALDAEVELLSPTRSRRLGIHEFVTDYRRTALAADELVVAVWIPQPEGRRRSAFVKCSTRSSLVISLAMVAVVTEHHTDGTVAAARVAVGACSPVAVRLPAVEAALLAGERRPWTAADLAPLRPIDDIRATAGYRLDVLPALIDDALTLAGVDRDG